MDINKFTKRQLREAVNAYNTVLKEEIKELEPKQKKEILNLRFIDIKLKNKEEIIKSMFPFKQFFPNLVFTENNTSLNEPSDIGS